MFFFEKDIKCKKIDNHMMDLAIFRVAKIVGDCFFSGDGYCAMQHIIISI